MEDFLHTVLFDSINRLRNDELLGAAIGVRMVLHADHLFSSKYSIAPRDKTLKIITFNYFKYRKFDYVRRRTLFYDAEKTKSELY
jgi:hypothetical protein